MTNIRQESVYIKKYSLFNYTEELFSAAIAPRNVEA